MASECDNAAAFEGCLHLDRDRQHPGVAENSMRNGGVTISNQDCPGMRDVSSEDAPTCNTQRFLKARSVVLNINHGIPPDHQLAHEKSGKGRHEISDIQSHDRKHATKRLASLNEQSG
jgi:hypothetical protein